MTDSTPDTRRKLADALDDFLYKHGDDVLAQQQERYWKFPRLSSLPQPLNVDPNLIADFTKSDAYKKAVDDYLNARTEENIVVTVLRLLRALIPSVLGSI
ncbi:MAG: hypothetical protein HQ592_18465 [Planctomycetes bacterium]|nr:hypothetical protein [Planctomycetota bacterium]